tara:strand:- start:212 stop:439 length:228 start_codon:yes stop_codon:yes gene_type:complete
MRKKRSYLSKIQAKKLGGIVQVLKNKEPVDEITSSLKNSGLIVKKEDLCLVTEKGLEEADRLSILAGIMVETKKK